MPEIAIANTSPLFYLHRLRLLEVLNKLYAGILVPVEIMRLLYLYRSLSTVFRT